MSTKSGQFRSASGTTRRRSSFKPSSTGRRQSSVGARSKPVAPPKKTKSVKFRTGPTLRSQLRESEQRNADLEQQLDSLRRSCARDRDRCHDQIESAQGVIRSEQERVQQCVRECNAELARRTTRLQELEQRAARCESEIQRANEFVRNLQLSAHQR